MHDCPCCGQPVYSANTDETCWGCHPLVECDPEQSWHCDGRNGHHCDGSACDIIAAVNEVHWTES